MICGSYPYGRVTRPMETRYVEWIVEKDLMDGDAKILVAVTPDLEGARNMGRAVLQDPSDPMYDPQAKRVRVRPCGQDGSLPVGPPVWEASPRSGEGIHEGWTRHAERMGISTS